MLMSDIAHRWWHFGGGDQAIRPTVQCFMTKMAHIMTDVCKKSFFCMCVRVSGDSSSGSSSVTVSDFAIEMK